MFLAAPVICGGVRAKASAEVFSFSIFVRSALGNRTILCVFGHEGFEALRIDLLVRIRNGVV